MTLSFGQWLKLGFGGIALMKKHAGAVALLRPLINDALDLWESVVPPQQRAAGDPAAAEDAITHTQALEKIRNGDFTAAEQAQFDRATQQGGAG